MNEMDEMRQQMAILKEKLKEQEIVNEELLRNAITSKMRSIQKGRWLKRVVIVFGLIYCPWMMSTMFEIPLWFIIATIAFFLVALIWEEVFSDGITNKDFSKEGLFETSRRLTRMRVMNIRWLWLGIPAAILWTLTFTWFIIQSEGFTAEESKGIYIGIAVGFSIGALLGTRLLLRQQRKAKELIADIEEMKRE